MLGNFRKHDRARRGELIDVFSSAPYFCGFKEWKGNTPYARDPRVIPRILSPPASSPIEAPATWLLKRGWQLGGENSGHLICLDKHTTGDATVAALAVLRALIEQRATLADATQPVTLFPQRLINVPVKRGWDWRGSTAATSAEQRVVEALGTAGRVLLRPSGTEPVLRVMVEARERALADTHAETLARAIATAAGQAL